MTKAKIAMTKERKAFDKAIVFAMTKEKECGWKWMRLLHLLSAGSQGQKEGDHAMTKEK